MPDEVCFRLCRASASLPVRATPFSAGYDCAAVLDSPLQLAPGMRVLVPLGFELAMPEDMEAQLRPRSGLALQHGITLLNTPGTIDPDYRGEVQVLLINLGTKAFLIEPGMKIAQLVFVRLSHPCIRIVEQLDKTERAAGGFGHSGV